MAFPSAPWSYLALLAVSAGESSALLGLVVPGETFVVGAGALAAQGELSVTWVAVVVVVGAVIGDNIGYALGRHFGTCRDHGLLGRVWSCARMSRVRSFLDRHGPATVFYARFVGLLRPLAPFAAGAVRMRYRPFLVANLLGATIWGTGTVAAGYLLGPAVERILRAGGVGAAGLVALAITALVVLRVARRHRAARPTGDRGNGASAGRYTPESHELRVPGAGPAAPLPSSRTPGHQ